MAVLASEASYPSFSDGDQSFMEDVTAVPHNDAVTAETVPPVSGMMPEGTGPLYKCAICNGLVYESQLDFHVQICPDPADVETAPLNPAVVAPESAQVSVVDLAPLAQAGNVAVVSLTGPSEVPGVVGELQAPAGPAFGRAQGDSAAGCDNTMTATAPVAEQRNPVTSASGKNSSLTQHRQPKSQHATHRRMKIGEELARREQEECTFAPKTLNRGSPRVTMRSAEVPGESRWSQHWEQRQRNQKLKHVEAQVYADVTHKPKISRFAQVWSQRQMEACGHGQALPSVFERLYSAAVQSRIAREFAREQMEAQLSNSAAVTEYSGSVTSGAPQLSTWSRKVPTTDLLYSDAMDRRERLRTLAEQLQARKEELAREKTQVIERSKRYYWQMLERQIKASFEAVAGAEPTLKHSMLEDFLVHFGLVRPGQESGVATDWPQGGITSAGDVVQASRHRADTRMEATELRNAVDEEGQKLRLALWRHLDPQNTGHVDLLTLTIFLHVLMGAVDDQAKTSIGMAMQNSGHSTLAPRHGGQGAYVDGVGSGVDADEDTDGTAPRNHGRSPVVVPDTVPGLAAISEEELSMGSGVPAQNLHGDIGAQQPRRGGTGVHVAEDESQRIMELLVRFDPSKLRAEFKSLYTHRLYYQTLQASAASATNADYVYEEVVSPEIDPHSRDLAERVAERLRNEIGESHMSHADVLLWRHKQAQEKIQMKRAQMKDEEVKSCTFQPATSSRRVQEIHDVSTPRGMSRNQVLYARAVADRGRKESRAVEAKARQEAEVATCTFKPNTARSERSYNRASEGSAPVPRGFYEFRQRQRAAGEVERQKRLQREDRLARVAPVGESVVTRKIALNVAATLAGGEGPPTAVTNLVKKSQQELGGSVAPTVVKGAANGATEGYSPQLPTVAEHPTRPVSASRRPATAKSPIRARASNSRDIATPERRTSPRDWGSGSGKGADNSGARNTPQRRESPGAAVASGGGTAAVKVGSSPARVPSGRSSSAEPKTWLQGSASAAAAASPSPGAGQEQVPYAPPGYPTPYGPASPVPTRAEDSPEPVFGASAQAPPSPRNAPPLLFVDVNIAPGQPPERIVIREGQSVSQVAAEFAAKHVLTPMLAQRLHALLRDVMEKEEQLHQAQAQT